MASTARGVAKVVTVPAAASFAIDPNDILGNSNQATSGYWLVNLGSNPVWIFQGGETATVEGDDGVPLLPNSWLLLNRPTRLAAGTSSPGWTARADGGDTKVCVIADISVGFQRPS